MAHFDTDIRALDHAELNLVSGGTRCKDANGKPGKCKSPTPQPVPPFPQVPIVIRF